ncbi:MAG: YraN family protein [Alphaproteobacteria bacterium]|nr:YraN family protein [Alphaproteobacteria bacterium]
MTGYRPENKRKAYFWGQGAEWLASLVLILKGYRILARRFKCKSGEIDLIAQKGRLICFIEVKARKNHHDALYALSHQQQQRIIKAAQWYLAKNNQDSQGRLAERKYRFDLMAVEPWHLPTHVKDAWQRDVMT